MSNGWIRMGSFVLEEDLHRYMDEQTSPVILPEDNHVTKNVLQDVHENMTGHLGHTLARSCYQYWVVASCPIIDKSL